MRAALRIARWLALGLVALVLLLLVSVHVALLTASGRSFVREHAERLVGDSLGAKFKIAELDALSIFGLQMRGIQLATLEGQVVLSASRIKVGLAPFALLFGRVQLDNLDLRDPFVELGSPDGTNGGLMGLLAQQTPQDKPASDSKEGSGLEIDIERVELHDADVRATFADARWKVSSFDAVGSIDIARGFSLGIERLRAQLSRNEAAIGAIEGALGRYRTEGGSNLKLSMRIADARLDAAGSLGAARGNEPGRIFGNLTAHGIDAKTLAALGVEEPALRVPIDFEAHVRGDTQAAQGSITLDAGEAGSLHSQLAFKAPLIVQAELQTAGIEPARLIDTEIAAFAGKVTLNVARANDRAPFELAAGLTDARYAEVPLPETAAQGRYDAERGLSVERFTARSGEMELRGSGAFDRAGALKLRAELSGHELESSPALQQVAPDVRGALEASVQVERATTGALDLDLHALLTRASVGGVQLRTLKLDGSGSGKNLAEGQAHAELEIHALHAGKIALDHANVALYGAGGVFTLLGRTDSHAELTAQARHHAHDWTVDASLDLPVRHRQDEQAPPIETVRFEQRAGSDTAIASRMAASGSKITTPNPRPDIVRAQLQQLRIESSGAIELPSLELRYQDASAVFSGSLSAKKRVAMRATIWVPRLSGPTALVLERPLHGTVQLTAEANGRLEKPELNLTGSYRCPNVEGLKNVVLGLDVATDPRANNAHIAADLRATGTAVHADVVAELRALSAAAIRRASYKVGLNVDRFPLHLLELWPRAPAVPNFAVLRGTASAQGNVESYALSTALELKARFAQDDAPITTSLEGSYAQKKLAIALRVEDKKGPLFRSALHTELAGPRIVLDRTSFNRLLAEHAWDAAAWLAARRVDELPALRALGVPPALWPAQVALDGELKHTPGSEPNGRFTASALWVKDPSERRARLCGLSGTPYLTFNASMKEGALDIWAGAGSDDQESLTAAFSSNAPIDNWLQVAPERVPPVTIDASFNKLQLGDLPVICERVRGNLDGRARLERGLTSAVSVSASLHGSALRFLASPPIDVILNADARGERVVAQGTLSAAGGKAELSAELPLDRKGRVPSVRQDAPFVAALRFEHVPAPALFAPVPGMQATTGKVDGSVAVSGTIADPSLRGRIDLTDVTAVLAKLGQRFERATGSILVDGRTVRIPELRFTDMQGRATASAEFTLNTLQPLTMGAHVKVDTDELPIRREGVLVAHLTANAAADIQITPERVNLEASLRKARIELTDDMTANVQPLAADPNIVFAGVAAPKQDAPEQNTALHVHITAPDPFWVRRSDFSTLVTADLTIDGRANGEPPSIVGSIHVDRGIIELLGQLFDIEQGTIDFSGGHSVEPTLNISATRRIPGGSGGVVRITASGAVHDLKLSFEVDGRTATAGDALAAALGTHASPAGGEDMKQQIGSVATGLAGSVLTLAARRELGPWVPVLALERGSGQTRVRAGVEADRFIPSFLRKVVVDAYVEGIFTAEDPSEGSQVTRTNNNAGAAVLLELRLPHDLSTDALYGPGDRWALDFGWEP